MKNRILVIEDNNYKSKALIDCLTDVFPNVETVQTDTISIAGQLIETEDWKGIVLDLAFHKTQKNTDLVDRPYLAGIGILQQLKEMRKTCPVVIATQHDSFMNTKYGNFRSVDELDALLRSAFSGNYKGLIKVDLGSTLWRDIFKNTVREAFL